ncbi:glycosyltransferase family 2 protein [Frondihabitans cladoniiphilus]|uniref:Glycosyltransferase 2-like domain-containing protein n=1 Tax=Frondihabitans cladoniiphilus TaxID=715785 RepID=A0ABP8WCH9_9MICO
MPETATIPNRTAVDGPVSPPSDSELVWYLGPQRRWVQVVTLVSFGLAAVSLTEFGISSPLMWPILIVVAVTVFASLLSIITGFRGRRMSERTHFATIDAWRAATDPTAHPSVDVFLPSCGEPMAVLRNTFTHVSRLDWPGQLDVWVMDDADKPEVEVLAAEFGFHYRVREDRGYMKKAGNLASAFGVTAGDFIVIFDADFVPRTDFLFHTIPYMDDEQIAIVQTPQFFETRGESMNWIERTAGSTQELFYRWIQPSRDRLGAPICVGTCAVYRRSALASVGGFVQIEHSEDVFTGLQLTRGGYSLRYLPVIVSKGLCPSDLSGFLNQQYRWANGSLTLMKSGKASRRPLSFIQRLCFFSGFAYYISTALNVFVLHIPGIVMATWFAHDVRASHFVPFLAGAWVYFVLLPRMSKSQWRFEVMRIQMAYSFAHALACIHKLTGRSAGWVATGAVGKSSSLSRTIATMGIVTITVTLGWSWAALIYDVATVGIKQFWPMGLFDLGYAYLGLPLLVEFMKIRFPGLVRTRAATDVAPDALTSTDDVVNVVADLVAAEPAALPSPLPATPVALARTAPVSPILSSDTEEVDA